MAHFVFQNKSLRLYKHRRNSPTVVKIKNMLGKLTVDFDFNTNTPVINIDIADGSNILADRTLKQFIQKASHNGLDIRWPKKDGDPYAQLRPNEDPEPQHTIDPLLLAEKLIKETINNGYLNADQSDKLKEFFNWVIEQQSF